ncbi:MAG: TIM barrel protein [Aurantimicrobium sp.]
MSAPFPLAVCAEMVFTDIPVVDRVREIDSRGYLVEIWDWSNKDLEALAATGATFSSMTGYLRGELIGADGANELLETARLSCEAAKIIDPPRLNVHGTGLDDKGLPVKPQNTVTAQERVQAIDTLKRLADLGAEYDRVFMLENLNLLVDHMGTPFGRAEDTIALISEINHPHLKLNLDLYHAQIGEGNLIELCKQALPWIGEIQIADVPGRMEPGTGEINYNGVSAALQAMGYTGVIGMEAWASGDSDLALERFRAAFS